MIVTGTTVAFQVQYSRIKNFYFLFAFNVLLVWKVL